MKNKVNWLLWTGVRRVKIRSPYNEDIFGEVEGNGNFNDMEDENVDGYGDENDEHGNIEEDGIEFGDDVENLHCIDEVSVLDNGEKDAIMINEVGNILNMDLQNISGDDVERLDFVDLEIAYLFYCAYAEVNGFSVRKSHVLRSKNGKTLQQTFLCSREGYREDRGLSLENRTREIKNETRCGCPAMCRVHVSIYTGRWYVTMFNFDHNHSRLGQTYTSLLPTHRKMNATDIMQMQNFRKVGIRVPHIHAAFANNCGGYHKVGFVRKDMYNQAGKQRREQSSDVNGVLNYFNHLRSKDPLMFVAYTVDDCRRLQHLFWCDGESRMNYKVFGDVLAFDATYKKNKYHCPVVVLSGINHHNQTIVFGTAIVTNETEQTYVWLLEQFLYAMKGKAPCSIITDGDVAMKNAIGKVFPNVHHRLCAWHLLRNATSNVRNPAIIPYLQKCMLSDFDVSEFEEKWNEMVAKFGLEDNNWINELYGKKKMWATAHIRGNFFAGIRTTSRCESFHMHLSKYVHSRINLTDFV